MAFRVWSRHHHPPPPQLPPSTITNAAAASPPSQRIAQLAGDRFDEAQWTAAEKTPDGKISKATWDAAVALTAVPTAAPAEDAACRRPFIEPSGHRFNPDDSTVLPRMKTLLDSSYRPVVAGGSSG